MATRVPGVLELTKDADGNIKAVFQQSGASVQSPPPAQRPAAPPQAPAQSAAGNYGLPSDVRPFLIDGQTVKVPGAFWAGIKRGGLTPADVNRLLVPNWSEDGPNLTKFKREAPFNDWIVVYSNKSYENKAQRKPGPPIDWSIFAYRYEIPLNDPQAAEKRKILKDGGAKFRGAREQGADNKWYSQNYHSQLDEHCEPLGPPELHGAPETAFTDDDIPF